MIYGPDPTAQPIHYATGDHDSAQTLRRASDSLAVGQQLTRAPSPLGSRTCQWTDHGIVSPTRGGAEPWLSNISGISARERTCASVDSDVDGSPSPSRGRHDWLHLEPVESLELSYVRYILVI